MIYHAKCLRGQLKLSFTGDIKSSSICHCRGCQRRTGSVFGAQVLLKKTQTVFQGETKHYAHTADSGSVVDFYSCPVCSSTLYWEIDYYPEHWVAAVGGFADANFPAPSFSVYEARKHVWLTLPDTIIEHMD